MSRQVPVRTCVGCRQRAAKSALMRVVVDDRSHSVVPDVDAHRHGRGAHLHPDAACLDQAVRRRAFPRALRVAGPLDETAVRAWIEAHGQGQPRT